MMRSERQRTFALPLWHLQQRRDDAQCFVDCTPRGPEARYVLNGRTLVSYRFATLAEVLDWAATKRRELESRGWNDMYAAA
jgi:hypothetical protein